MDQLQVRTPPDSAKEYENLTTQLRYLNDKIIEAFSSFVHIATAIIGGTFYFSILHYEQAKKHWFEIDLLLIGIGSGYILFILNNLWSWYEYREELSKKFGGIDRPKPFKSCRNEILMCVLIILAVMGFVFLNPLGRPTTRFWCCSA